MKQIDIIREEHGPMIEMLLDGRISHKEITIHTWAEVASKKKDMPFDKAYKAAKLAARSLASANFGRYVEGRRGRVSRFKAKSDIKEIAKGILGSKGKAEARIPAAKAMLSEEPNFSVDEIRALKRLLSSATMAEEPPPKPSLEHFSADELLAEVNRRIAENKKRD